MQIAKELWTTSFNRAVIENETRICTSLKSDFFLISLITTFEVNFAYRLPDAEFFTDMAKNVAARD